MSDTFSEPFLKGVADDYGLTQEQTEVLVLRLVHNKTHATIAKELGISRSASLQRAAGLYKKFPIETDIKNHRDKGKDAILRTFLLKLKQQQMEEKKKELDKLHNNNIHRAAILRCLETNSKNSICHNLPHLEKLFIGRKEERIRLFNWLYHNNQQYIYCVTGMGGVGKTTLVRQVAEDILNPPATSQQDKKTDDIPQFDAIVYMSAKTEVLSFGEIAHRLTRADTLEDLFRAIEATFNLPIIQEENEEAAKLIQEILCRKKTLIIIDNWETLSGVERKKILAFLQDSPRHTKAIFTSRETLRGENNLPLDSLSYQEGYELVKRRSQDNNLYLSKTDQEQIAKHSWGIPLVINYIIALLSNGFLPSEVIDPLIKENFESHHQVIEFIFKKVVIRLKENNAYELFMTLALLDEFSTESFLLELSGLNSTRNKKTLSEYEKAQKIQLLEQLSLLLSVTTTEKKRQGDFRCHAMTRAVAQQELNKNRSFKRQVEKRFKCIKEDYRDLVNNTFGEDWEGWKINSLEAEQKWKNIKCCLDYLKLHNDYKGFFEIWKGISRWTLLVGYWRERLTYLDWLRQAPNTTIRLKASISYAWTLIQRNDEALYKEAEYLQLQLWNEFRKKLTRQDAYILAGNIGVLALQQGKYEDAEHWLAKYSQLLENMQDELNEAQLERARIRRKFYDGKIALQRQEYAKAQDIFQQVIKRAKDVSWGRRVEEAKTYLAQIELEKNVGSLDSSQETIEESLKIAQQFNSRKLIAKCCKLLKRIAEEHNEAENAKKYSAKAQEISNFLEVLK